MSRDSPRSEFYSGSAETVIISPIANDGELEMYLKYRIMVLSAGALAQAFDGSDISALRLAQIRADNAEDDMGKARELFAIYLNRRIAQNLDLDCGNSDTWEQHPFWLLCESAATKIVQENWTAIDLIATTAEHILRDTDCLGQTTEQLAKLGWGEVASDK